MLILLLFLIIFLTWSDNSMLIRCLDSKKNTGRTFINSGSLQTFLRFTYSLRLRILSDISNVEPLRCVFHFLRNVSYVFF